jgi:hypothetical protein
MSRENTPPIFSSIASILPFLLPAANPRRRRI